MLQQRRRRGRRLSLEVAVHTGHGATGVVRETTCGADGVKRSAAVPNCSRRHSQRSGWQWLEAGARLSR